MDRALLLGEMPCCSGRSVKGGFANHHAQLHPALKRSTAGHFAARTPSQSFEQRSTIVARTTNRVNFERGHSTATTAHDFATVSNAAQFRTPINIASPPSSTPTKIRVAVDVDEVLGRFLHSLNQYCHEAYGQRYEISDYHVYDFAKVWNCHQDESNRIVHEFFDSHHFAAGIEVIPGALESLLRLQNTFDLVVVTSRQHIIQSPTLDWIDRHFPGVFSDVHFGNHFALEGASRPKSEICRSVGAHVLIDDNPRYAEECAKAGIQVLLYDWDLEYPWSKTEGGGPTHELITRVRNWEEVEVRLAALVQK